MNILAAMSGGVDSAVAAARAVDAGHDVTGIHLALSRNPASYRSGARGCCTIEDSNDARRAADVIGIPFYVWDLSERFHEDVVEDFMDEYAAGRTPNPCLRCNEKIKFAAVLDRALGLGFDAVATGHYAQLRTDADGRSRCTVPSTTARTSPTCSACSTRSSCGTPSSRSATRPRPTVRAEAAERGLLVADKPDSHDICFVADGDTPGWLREKLGERAPNQGGAILDESGQELGQHDGTYGFTIGQRKGLRLGRPAPDGKPRFVLDIEPVSGTVTVGPRERLAVHRLTGSSRAGAALARPGSRGPTSPCSCARTATRIGPWSPSPATRSRWNCSIRRTASRPARPRSSTTAPGWSGRRRSRAPSAVRLAHA